MLNIRDVAVACLTIREFAFLPRSVESNIFREKHLFSPDGRIARDSRWPVYQFFRVFFSLQRGHAHDGEDVAEYTEDGLYLIAAFAIGRE